MIKSSSGTLKNKVFYAGTVFGQEEKDAVMRSLENGWIASGQLVNKFEEEIAQLFNKKYGVAVNSGSSANLIAIKALGIPEGSEVITPACTFSTTVAEIINNNLTPVFVDVVIGRYTINEDLVEKAITKKTRAILVPQLVGGVCDMPKLYKLAQKYGLYLIDDSCDTIAPKIGQYTVSRYAHVSTTSFYASHIITAFGMGGMVLTNNKHYRNRLVTLRDWGRVGNDSEEFSKRFDFNIDNIPYDAKFLYSEFGFNLKMNEANAAFGLEQIKKLPKFLKIRQDNFNLMYEYFKQYGDYFHLPFLLPKAKTNWLAFPLTIKNAPFTRYNLLKHLESKGIQTRVLFSGNITRHPVYKENNSKWRVSGTLENSDYIMANSFLLGCHHNMGAKEVEYIKKSFEEFLK